MAVAPVSGWQDQWRWCCKCQSLFFGGGDGGVCPAGARHSSTGSNNYAMVSDAHTAMQDTPFQIISALGDQWVIGVFSGSKVFYAVADTALRRIAPQHKWLLRWWDQDPSAFHLCLPDDPKCGMSWRAGRGDILVVYHGQGYDMRAGACQIDATGPGWVAINNLDHDRVLDVKGADVGSDNISIIGYPWNGGNNQRWRMVPVV